LTLLLAPLLYLRREDFRLEDFFFAAMVRLRERG
jgi:hypothetical protein